MCITKHQPFPPPPSPPPRALGKNETRCEALYKSQKKQLIFTYRSCLYVFCIAPLMHTSFYLMVRGPAIQQTRLLSLSFDAIEMDKGVESYKYHCFGGGQSLFRNGHGGGVCACLVPFSRWDDDRQMVETICGVFISINEL